MNMQVYEVRKTIKTCYVVPISRKLSCHVFTVRIVVWTAPRANINILSTWFKVENFHFKHNKKKKCFNIYIYILNSIILFDFLLPKSTIKCFSYNCNNVKCSIQDSTKKYICIEFAKEAAIAPVGLLLIKVVRNTTMIFKKMTEDIKIQPMSFILSWKQKLAIWW